MKKVVVVDMDGTLLNASGHVGEKTKELFLRLAQDDVMVVLASGRPWRAMEPYYKMLGCYGPVICYNGALVFNPSDPSFPAISRKFKASILREIHAKTASISTSFMAEDLENIYVSRVDSHLKKYFWYEGMNVHIGNIEADLYNDTYTALFRTAHSKDKALEDVIAEYEGIELRHWTHSFYSELALSGVDKGSALRHVMEALHLQKEDVIAFGDAGNDFSMLKEAGMGFAMKGCKSKRLSDHFPSAKKGNAQDGVALTLLDLLY